MTTKSQVLPPTESVYVAQIAAALAIMQSVEEEVISDSRLSTAEERAERLAKIFNIALTTIVNR